MSDTIIIKKEDGKSISVTATQEEAGIVLTKTGDKTADNYKRKFIIEAMDINVYNKFIEAKIDGNNEVNNLLRVVDFLKHIVK
jgi:hypothetical protein